jgi:hypothetical protein
MICGNAWRLPQRANFRFPRIALNAFTMRSRVLERGALRRGLAVLMQNPAKTAFELRQLSGLFRTALSIRHCDLSVTAFHGERR